MYPQSGVREGFHVASHHANNRANMDKYALINKYHVQMLAYFLDKLKATPDGDGNLLDHSLVLYGSSMSNGNQHDHDPLPVVLAGGASGQLKGGRHMQYPEHTPMSNLLLTMLDKLGRPSGSPWRQYRQAGNLTSAPLRPAVAEDAALVVVVMQLRAIRTCVYGPEEKPQPPPACPEVAQ